jgi:hypothetical protein
MKMLQKKTRLAAAGVIAASNHAQKSLVQMVHAASQIMIFNLTRLLTAVLMMAVVELTDVVLVRPNVGMDAAEDFGDIGFVLEVSLNSSISLDILQGISSIKRESRIRP